MKGNLIIKQTGGDVFSGAIEVTVNRRNPGFELIGRKEGSKLEVHAFSHSRYADGNLVCSIKPEESPDTVMFNFFGVKPGMNIRLTGQLFITGKYTSWSCSFSRTE